MKVRLGLALAAAVLMVGAGCASGGPSGAASGSAGGGQQGIRPRNNEHTRAAELFLTQALSTEDEAQATQRFQQALDAALAGIAADPQNPQSFFQAGQAMVGVNDFVGADSMLTKAEEMYPVYELEAESWRERGWVNAYNMGITPLNEGNLEEAARLFKAANDLYSARPEALLQLGSVYARLDQPEESAQAFRDALALLEETKEEQLADTSAAEFWQQHYEIATMGLGQAYIFSQDYEAAAEFYGGLLAEDPDNVELIGNLASALSEIGQADSTRADFYADSVQALYDRLLSRPGLTERDLFNAGVGLYQIENWERAAEAFQMAAEMNPFNRDARLNLTQTYYAGEMWEELITAARALIEVDPRNQIVWQFLLTGYGRTEQNEEANRVYEEYEATPFWVQNINLEANPEGGAVLRGEVMNATLQPGTTVTIRFHFGGPNGQEIGTETVRVQVPAPEETQSFSAEVQTSQPVMGYRYEVVG